ncbi:MAG TPA: hypothetical protein VM802_28100 [Chitinophaga sp.]|uniref:hypothetical protein n=1 Tax=Chitinophaga sp. TaxID=1869181 RepID=UPI002C77E8E6|nr:hypothetical protein [Chitinophaga sp.]HVI48764.1 hypothetical protein [Chitinophaga sp.]
MGDRLKRGSYKGAELPDPQGTGKISRYIEIKNEAMISNPVIRTLLTAGLDACKKRVQKI